MSRMHKARAASIVFILAFVVLTFTGCADYKIRKTLDKYESLVDTYVEFVEKYGKNPEYGTYPESEFMELMEEWAEVTAAVEEIDVDKLSEDDVLYFTDVIGRVTLKLSEIESDNTQTEKADQLQNVPGTTSPGISQPASGASSNAAEGHTIATSSNSLDLDSNAMDEELCYQDIPASELMGLSAVEIVEVYFGRGCNADGNGHIWYDDIDFYMIDDETMDRIVIYNVGDCGINGESLKVNSDGVIEQETIIDLFGQDYEDEWLDTGYYISYHYPAYTLSFEVNKFSEVCSILIRNP